MGMRKFNRNEPVSKNFERMIYGVAIVVIFAIVARCSGVMPE
jgi:hypothetical protein